MNTLRSGCALMPGLINLLPCGHESIAGFADDLPLMTWLQRYIWPAEQQFVSPEFVRDGTELALADLLLGGTTTLVDQYFFPEVTATALDRAGMRALLTFPVIDLKTAWARDAEECINRGPRCAINIGTTTESRWVSAHTPRIC